MINSTNDLLLVMGGGTLCVVFLLLVIGAVVTDILEARHPKPPPRDLASILMPPRPEPRLPAPGVREDGKPL